MDVQDILTDFSLLGILLGIGAFVRSRSGLLQRFVIPASVIGGAMGLILGPVALGWLPISDSVSRYPPALANVLFAGLLLGRKIPPFGVLARTAGAQTAFAYFNAFGQIAVGLLVVIVFNALGYGLHPTFGFELLVGYQGGPGVATAVAPMFGQLGWSAQDSAAIGESCAIAGLVLSVLIGVVLVNLGVARGFSVKSLDRENPGGIPSTFVPQAQRRPVCWEVVRPGAASALAFQFGFMAVAVLGGSLIVEGITWAAPKLAFLPTFPFALVAGILLQSFLQKAKLDAYVDRGSIEAISSFALDLLIVASLVALEVRAVFVFALPLAVMVLLGLLFNLWQVMWLAPRILPGAWFEKGICEYGQNTGSVPQALLLLRMVDPRIETDAAEAFGLKMFLFSPIMFPLAMVVLPLVISRGPLFFLVVYGLVMVGILALCRVFTWHRRTDVKWFGPAA